LTAKSSAALAGDTAVVSPALSAALAKIIQFDWLS